MPRSPRRVLDVESASRADQLGPVGTQLPCRRHDPNLFFAESPADVERAKAICGPCPVRAVCLAAALERREPWGVWGGELFLDGVVVPRKRPRGRPRKEEQRPVAAGAGPAGAGTVTGPSTDAAA